MHRPATAHGASIALLVSLLAAACGGTDTPSASPASTPSPEPTTSALPATPAASPSPTATPPPIVHDLSIYSLPQVDDLFRGARVASMAGGRAGAVILGTDIASGALVSWTSADGDGWQRHWLPGSTFGGGSPEKVVGGDFGYLAVGWRVRGLELVDALWLSRDGITWQPVPVDAMPEGPITGLTAGPAGIEVAVSTADGATVVANSSDGGSWRRSRLPGLDVGPKGLVALPDGFMILGSIKSVDTSGNTMTRRMAWRSEDGIAWTGNIDLSNAIYGLPDGIETWVASPYGLAGSGAGGGVTLVTAADVRFLPLAPTTYGRAVGGPAALLWVAGASLDGACAAAWQFDGKGWIQLDNVAGGLGCLDATTPVVVGSAAVDGGAVVYGLLGPDFKRVAWLVRASGQPPRGTAAGGPVPNAPGASIPDPLAVTIGHPSSCPSRPTTVAAMIELDPALAVGCFGSDPLSFRAWVVDPGEGYGGTCGQFTPRWILECVLPDYLLSGGVDTNAVGRGMLHAMRSPTASGDLTGVGRWVQVTGHFDDPVSPTCRFGGGDSGPTIGFEPERPRAEAVLDCRKVFVVSRLRNTSAP
ncbi:MAG: hypothetical protein HY264_09455 [Chloroflexi bacterium]|nr:hypothetical protein [Chloroflexota bacterium]